MEEKIYTKAIVKVSREEYPLSLSGVKSPPNDSIRYSIPLDGLLLA